MYLRILLLQYKRSLLMTVLDQEGIQTGDSFEYQGCMVASAGSPQISGNTLYIRGDRKSSNDDLCLQLCGSESAAFDLKTRFVSTIAAFFRARGIDCPTQFSNGIIFEFGERPGKRG
jgi:hypothetical protein